MNKVWGLVNGTVLTMSPQGDVSQAVLIDGDRIVMHGSSAEVQSLCEARKGKLRDLRGATVLPGFYDCHVHMMGTGLNALGIDMYDCRSVSDILEQVREASRTYPQERWIFGKRLDESRLLEKRPPTAAELEEVAPDHIVYIVDRGWHYTLINNMAFDRIGLSKDLPGIGLTADGHFNGRLHEEANNIAKTAFFSQQDPSHLKRALHYTASLAASAGVTTLHAVEGGVLFADSYIPTIFEIQDQLPVNVLLYWCTEDIQRIKAAGLPRQGKDIMLDGSIGSRTAAFDSPYADAPGTCGSLYHTDAEVEVLVEAAHLANVHIAFHAIGELAISQALDAFERVLARYPKKDHRHCIDHFGFPKPGEIERAAELGVVISTQPAFMYLRAGPGQVYNERLGEERARRGYTLRKFLDAGITVGGGSDSDVTALSPLLGIHAAVNQPYPESSISVEEALRMYTYEAAKLTFGEELRGSVADGKVADLVVLAQNPLEVSQTVLKDIDVVMTVKSGQVTYEKERAIGR
ncbi:MAG: amidohydrolase [Anaerolineae bacterium]|nr:amidohydrolase [Anaerolineae bacterium]